jgi:hypothetical protein
MNGKDGMKNKIILAGIAALALSALTASACYVEGVVSCPNGTTAAGIRVYVVGGAETTTDGAGLYFLELNAGGKFTVCVDSSTLPTGLTIKGNGCANGTVDPNDIVEQDFTLDGPACSTPPPPGPCWLTGGGTIGKTKGVANFTYGGVVDPACSSFPGQGGNWNVLDHLQGVHFIGKTITVLDCGGVPTGSPKVSVNVIDFAGTGKIGPLGGETTDVSFVAQAIDNNEPGSGSDALWLKVFDSSGTVLMLISGNSDPSVVSPVTISTGNLQIHQTSCQN